MSVTRRLLTALLGSALYASRAVAEEPPGLELAWQAPEGCPQAPAIRARVRELTGSGVNRALSADGVIERTSTRYELTLVIRDGRAVSERVLQSDSCADLGGAAAVTLSLLMRGSPPSGKEPPVATQAPAPPAARPAPRAAPPSASARSRNAVPGLRAGLAAPLVTAELGPLPQPSVGVALGPRLTFRGWSLVALGQLTRTQDLAFEEYPGFGAELSRMAASLGVCRGFRLGRAELAPCVLLWLEHLRATGTGIDVVPRTKRATWLSPALGFRGHYHLMEWLALVGIVSGRVEGSRPRLSVLGLGEVERLGPAALMVAAGTEWIF